MGIVPGGGSVLLYLGAHKFIEKIQKDTAAVIRDDSERSEDCPLEGM